VLILADIMATLHLDSKYKLKSGSLKTNKLREILVTDFIFNSEKGEAVLESKYVDALGDLASDWWVIPVE
jgi:hypothetical protein